MNLRILLLLLLFLSSPFVVHCDGDVASGSGANAGGGGEPETSLNLSAKCKGDCRIAADSQKQMREEEEELSKLLGKVNPKYRGAWPEGGGPNYDDYPVGEEWQFRRRRKGPARRGGNSQKVSNINMCQNIPTILPELVSTF